MAPRVYELVPSDDAEEHLWRHRLYAEDAYEVLAENRYKIFRNPGHSGRVQLVGFDKGGRLLTFVIEMPDDRGAAILLTGWLADDQERALYSRPGGTKNA